jgi:hypothetical protein
MLDTAALMTSASKTINFVEAFGHVDAYFEGSHRQNLDQPILAWLERVVSRQYFFSSSDRFAFSFPPVQVSGDERRHRSR